MNEVLLVLVEGTANHAEGIVSRRSEPNLLAHLLEVIGAHDELLRANRPVPVSVEVLEIGQASAISAAVIVSIKVVVRIGVVGVISDAVRRAIHVGAGVRDIEVMN